MLVYCITNLANGKKYIGQTIRSIEERWHEHSKPSNDSIIGRAIRKYGVNSFQLDTLETSDSLENLNLLEEQLIKAHNTISPKGYNISYGGDNKALSDTTKQKLSKINLGKKLTDTHKASLARAGRNRIKNTIKPVMQLVPNGQAHLFASITSAAVFSGSIRSHISDVCKGRREKAGGYRWKYLHEPSTEYKAEPKKSIRRITRAVVQYDMNDQVIGEYFSIRDAVIQTGFTSISYACAGITNTAGGYRWKYKNERPSFAVRCSNGKTFNSVKHASVELGLTTTNIYRMLSGRNKTAGGLSFKYTNQLVSAEFSDCINFCTMELRE